MLLERRHAPVSRRRRTTAYSAAHKRDGAASPRGKRRSKTGILDQDHADRRRGGRFRWFLSTCLAAGIGAFAIIFVVLGARDPTELTSIVSPQAANAPTIALPEHSRGPGLSWSLPKADRLVATNDALSTRFIIHESIRQRRDNREYLLKKTYARVVGRLASAPSATDNDRIPAFNPYTLYAEPKSGDADDAAKIEKQDANARIVELLGGILPTDDGQEMDQRDVVDAVIRDAATDEPASIRPAFQAEGIEKASPQSILAQRSARAAPSLTPPGTTDIPKNRDEGEDSIDDDLENREVRVVKVARNDTLTRIIDRLSGDVWQKRAIVEAARPHIADNALVPGQEVHVTLVPSVTRQGRFEPVRVSIFGDGHEHKVTLTLNAGGDFIASQSPIDERMARAALADDKPAQTASLYNSLYVTALSQGINHDLIAQILRVHANDTDYRRRARNGDQFELFFDVREDDSKRTAGALGELLMTSLTIGGETRKFYRFRTPDGAVDYYDEQGNTSRQFLMRRPVRSEQVRLASGFGMRRHPILGQYRLHAGVDWSGPIGSPIMASGAGTVEEAGRKGEYGNHIRIRHANGYRTTYSHMSRFGSGISQGVRVSQGQVIGYIGNTGLSTGPHLHYEVTINNQPVDPMAIQVPKDKRITGKQLADFHKERVRIDDLIRRNPVSTVNVDAPNRN